MLLRLTLALIAASAVAVPSVALADTSGPGIVSFVNQQRAAHGIPAGIVEDATLSAACANHNRYGAANGVLEHDETEGRPGYSSQGRDAAKASVLYRGSGPWTATRNPFEEAPIHLHQLLAPRLDRMGAAETGSYGCATTLASRARPAPASDVSYSYPGGGATGWPTAQTASEAPFTPGERVGIPAGTRTGPYLYVLFDGPGLSPYAQAQLTGASLRGPDGSVALRTVDNTTPGLADLLPPGAELIPRAPLRPRATYTASVTATVSDSGVAPRAFSRTWSFTTGAASSPGRPGSVPGPGSGVAGSTSDGLGAIPNATSSRTPARRRNGSAATSSPSHGGRSGARFFRLTAKFLRLDARELRVRASCSLACGVVAAGTVRASGRTVRRRGRDVGVRGRTVRVSGARGTLPRAGSQTLRFRLSKRDARRLRGRGRRTLRLRVSGVDVHHRRSAVTLRARA